MRLESDKDERWFLGFEYKGQDVFMKECVYVEEERSNFFYNKDEYANYEQGQDHT